VRFLALLRGVLAAVGIVLLGAALAWAPVVAFQGGDMTWVTKAGIAGVAIALIAKLVPVPRAPRDPPNPDPAAPHER